jgi:hypothetical protein
LASKQYISIIRLLEHCGISTNEELNLTRVKKQLSAEFGMSANGFIEVDGHTYTRNDVFEELDRPDFSERLVYHRQLWHSPQLREWLENNNVNLYTIADEFTSFLGDKKFDEFFSIYFSGPFNYAARTILTSHHLTEMGKLLAYEEFIQPAEREDAFRPIRIYLDDALRTLRNINGDNYSMMRPKIVQWIEEDWYTFFNNLPPEFYEIKFEIVTKLINIGVAVQKTHRNDCRLVSEQLVSLKDTPEALRGIIVSNNTVYSNSSSSSSSSWRSYWWIIWVIFMLVRAGTSDGCNSKPSYDFKEKFQVPVFTIDSSGKVIRNGLDTLPIKIWKHLQQ